MAIAVLAAPSAAQNLTPAAHLAIDDSADDLRAGQYLWRDAGYSETPVSVTISVPLQLAFVYRGDRLIGAASVSTGKKGKSTPLGDFTILQKRVFHRSNLYSNAPMPFMQRLTWSGIALHAGHNPGYPASHGCIRLPRAFAEKLFAVTALGVPVTIVGGDAMPPIAPAIPMIPKTPLFPTIIVEASGLRSADFALVTWRDFPPEMLRVGGDETLVPDIALWLPRRG